MSCVSLSLLYSCSLSLIRTLAASELCVYIPPLALLNSAFQLEKSFPLPKGRFICIAITGHGLWQPLLEENRKDSSRDQRCAGRVVWVCGASPLSQAFTYTGYT